MSTALSALALLVAIRSASAADSPSGARPAVVPWGAGVADGVARLSNGMRVLLLETRGNPMVASTVVVLSGVDEETPETNGASHFLEHLLFDGTTSRTGEQIANEADAIGAYNNATTRDDYTLFQILVHKDHLAEALAIQADMLFRSTIPESAFEKERGIVLEEMARDESGPSYAPEAFFRRCYFGADPRSMSVLGTTSSIKAMTREAVVEHYRRCYRPERMVLLLAGDIETGKALALAEKVFAAPPAPAPPATGKGRGRHERAGAAPSAGRAVPAPQVTGAAASSDGAARGPTAAGENPGSTPSAPLSARPAPRTIRAGFYRQRIQTGRGYVHLAIPAPGAGAEDAAEAETIAAILGGGPGSRLGAALTGPRGQLAFDSSASWVPGPGAGRIEIEATLPPESDAELAIKRIRSALRVLTYIPVPEEELRSVVEERKSEALYLRDQVHYLGMQIAHELALAPSPSLGCGGPCFDALTPERVRAAAARWLTAEPVVTLSSPAVPEGVDPSVPAPIPDPGVFDEEPAGSEPATAGTTEEVRRIVFDNGLTLLVASTPGSEVLAAHVLVRGRASEEPEGRDGIADVVHRALPYGSLGLDQQALAAKLRGLGARLKTVDDPNIPYDDYYTSPRYSYVRFETLRDDWREGLGLLFTTLVWPRLGDVEIAQVVAEELDLARRGQESPQALAKALYLKTLAGGGPLSRRVTGSPETLGSIRPDEVRAFHARYFEPANLILSIVSDLPVEEIIAAVRETFGALPAGPLDCAGRRAAVTRPPAAGVDSESPVSSGPSGREHPDRGSEKQRAGTIEKTTTRASAASTGSIADPPVTTARGRVEVKAGKEQSQIYLGRIFDRDTADLAPLIVATTVLSKRIANELRETRGLAYSVGCSLEEFGARSWFTASMGTRPANIEEAEAGLRSAIARFSDEKIPKSEIDRAVNAMRGQMAMRRMTRISQAYSLGFNELLGRGTDFDAKLDAAIGAVTPDDLRRVARRYLDPDRMVAAIAR